MKTPTSTSLVKILEDIGEKINANSVHDHIMIVLESDENGLPSGKIVKVKGSPFPLLGMIDIITNELQKVKKQVIEKFEDADKMTGKLNNATGSQRARLKELDNAARQAAQRGDEEALEAIKAELISLVKNLVEKQNDSDNDDDTDSTEFNIDDLKGMF